MPTARQLPRYKRAAGGEGGNTFHLIPPPPPPFPETPAAHGGEAAAHTAKGLAAVRGNTFPQRLYRCILQALKGKEICRKLPFEPQFHCVSCMYVVVNCKEPRYSATTYHSRN